MLKLSFRDFPMDDMPREKLAKLGVENLTDTELLAIILRSGGHDNKVKDLAHNILSQSGGLKGLLNFDFHQLKNIRDMGPAKASCVKALAEICLRMNMEPQEYRAVVRKPEDVFNYLRKDFYAKTKEYLYLLSLDARSTVISKDLISIGTLNETLVHPREVFRQAFVKNAVTIVLAHNHPSGNSTPSPEDFQVTKRLADAGATLGISLLDHVIICDDTYSSIKALTLAKGGEKN